MFGTARYSASLSIGLAAAAIALIFISLLYPINFRR